MLNGGEKSKLKRLIHAINNRYPEILDLLESENLKKDTSSLDRLFDINKEIFKWLSNLSYSLLNNNPVVSNSFKKLQASNRTQVLNHKDEQQIDLLLDSIDAIYDLQKELIRMVDEDSNLGKGVLKQIIDELGLEPPKGSSESRRYSSIDDLFSDLED